DEKMKWYAIYPEGGAWCAVKVSDDGKLLDMVEESNASTHITAQDRYSGIAERVMEIADREPREAPREVARRVVAAWHSDADPDLCLVEELFPEGDEE